MAFCSWLGSCVESVVGPSWRSRPVDELWFQILDEHMEAQVETLLEQDPEFMEASLNDLMCQAQTQAHAGGTVVGNGKCVLHALSDGPTPASRCQRRMRLGKIAAARRKLQLKRIKRRLACYRASVRLALSARVMFLVGSWNTRGLGAKFGKDPAGKIDAIFKVIAERRWSCALLTDLRFEESGSGGSQSWWGELVIGS